MALVNATYGFEKKSCEPKIVLTKLRWTLPYIFTLLEFCIMWKVSMYELYVCVSEGICVKYIYLGSFLKALLVKFP